MDRASTLSLLLALLTLGAAAAFAWTGLERREGCPEGGPEAGMCFGPRGDYWTLFDTELPFLATHLGAGALVGLVVGGALAWRARRSLDAPRVAVAAGWALAAGAVAFVALAAVAPVRVVY